MRASAELARLAVDEAEARRLGPEFERILSHFRVLAEVDVEGVEASISPVPAEAFERRDAPAAPSGREALLEAAPDRRGDFFGVPKVIGDET